MQRRAEASQRVSSSPFQFLTMMREERGEARLGPELAGPFEAVLELCAEGLDGPAADGDTWRGVGDILHVSGVAPEVGQKQETPSPTDGDNGNMFARVFGGLSLDIQTP